MADTGKIATSGFGAGAIKYVTLGGFVPNTSATTLIPCVVSMGFGLNAIPKLTLLGFAMPHTTTSSSAFEIFTGGIFGVAGMTS